MSITSRQAMVIGAALCGVFWCGTTEAEGKASKGEVTMPEVKGGEHPRLLFDASEIDGLRKKAASEDGRAIVARLKMLLKREPVALDAGFHAAGHALLYLIEGEEEHAKRARALVDDVVSDRLKHESQSTESTPLWNSNYKMILKTDPAVGVALAYDLCYATWSEAERKALTKQIDAKARELVRGGGQGWNASPASNWTANTSTAAAICALAVMNDDGTEHARATYERAVERFWGYLRVQSRDRGWTQESWIYYRYPMLHHVLPFLSIDRHMRGGRSAFEGTAADWFALLYTHVLIDDLDAAAIPNGAGTMEQSHWRGGEYPCGLATVPREKRPAFLWTMQGRYGKRGDGTYGIALPHHAIFALAALEPEMEAVNPGELLDNVWVDRGNGLVLFRNRWQDGDDCIVGVDANVKPARGTGKPECTGAFTIVGLGNRWAVAGAEDRLKREHFNVVQAEHVDAKAGGALNTVMSRKDGSGLATVWLNAVYTASPAPRYRLQRTVGVDYSGKSGAAAVIAVADRIFDTSAMTWVMHGYGQVKIEGSRFAIEGENKATLCGVFLAPGDVKVTAEQADSKGGSLPRFKLKAASKDGQFLVVMALQRGKAPEVKTSGPGEARNVQVGEVTIVKDSDIVIEGAQRVGDGG